MSRLKLPVIIIIMLMYLVSNGLAVSAASPDIDIFLNGKNVSKQFNPIKKENTILVKALSLSQNLKLEINWLSAINTLELKNDKISMKMMADSPYLQFGNRTVKTQTGMVIRNDHTYVPFRKTLEGFGYLIDYSREKNAYYIFKPKALVKEVHWSNQGQILEIEMDKLTPYRINMTDDPHKLILELERASLAKNFRDNFSNSQYYLSVNRIENQSSLQLVFESKYPIPFQLDKGIREKNGSLQLRFLPQIQSITWTNNNYLEIMANNNLSEPKITHLQDPKRLVLDFPGLMLSDFNMDFKENKWVKDVRVSQFTYDPVVLRVVLEIKQNKNFKIVSTDQKNKVLLRPGTTTIVKNLNFKNNTISFRSNTPIEPELFTLGGPPRLVINLQNAIRKEGFPSELNINNNFVKKLRAAKFDTNVVRIVADLNKQQNYKWDQNKLENGDFQHKIILGQKFKRIRLADNGKYTDIKIDFTDSVNFEIDKFSYPHRLVVDISEKGVRSSSINFPQPQGIIKEMRTSRFEKDGEEVTRLVFELNKYEDYKLISDNPGKTINIRLPKQGRIAQENVIVLDPGHGGFDPGAVGPSGTREKNLNLKLALMARNILKEQGYQVQLTRTRDTFLSLRERVRFANQKNACLFVSIHINASHKKYSEGTETFLAPQKPRASYNLARELQSSLIQELELFDRGIKRENFYVIRHTKMPSALVEVAFLSNPHEESLLTSRLFQEKAARSIARGITDFLKNSDR